MVWLVGAMVTYGIVALLVGIAAFAYLSKGTNLPTKTDSEILIRARLDRLRRRARRGAAPGTRVPEMR